LRRVTVHVPASTANLGPGYDAFGLALARHNQVKASFAPPGQWRAEVSGEDEDRDSSGRGNLVTAAMQRLFDEIGEERAASISCVNEIPFGRGLGSSSAAIVGGLVAANELAQARLSPDEIFRLAVELEGHPDNVAAALYGGFTISWTDGGVTRTAHVDPPGGLAAVCVVSDLRFSTSDARSMLPATVPHADAVFDAGRAGLLAVGLALGRRDLIGPGMADRLHEPYRSPAVADLEEVRSVLLKAGADGAALSGAGPTVIGLVAGSDDADALARASEVASRAAGPLARSGGRRVPEVIAIDRDGAVVVE
jgi:homoserine kinase